MSDPVVYTLDEWCEAHRCSRGHFYKMQRAGTAPRVMKTGSRVLISGDAAADWRREREKAAPVKVENGPSPPAKPSNGGWS
jgi:hypothetical protein